MLALQLGLIACVHAFSGTIKLNACDNELSIVHDHSTGNRGLELYAPRFGFFDTQNRTFMWTSSYQEPLWRVLFGWMPHDGVVCTNDCFAGSTDLDRTHTIMLNNAGYAQALTVINEAHQYSTISLFDAMNQHTWAKSVLMRMNESNPCYYVSPYTTIDNDAERAEQAWLSFTGSMRTYAMVFVGIFVYLIALIYCIE